MIRSHFTRLWRRANERASDRETAAREEHQRRLDYHAVFGSEQGQRVLADILRRCGVMKGTFAGCDTHLAAFHEGRRRVGLELIETLNQHPDAVSEMLRTGQVEDLFE